MQKKHIKNQKIVLENKLVFFTQEISDFVCAAKAKTKTKKKRKQPRKCPVDKILNENNVEIVQIDCESLDSNCIVVARRT